MSEFSESGAPVILKFGPVTTKSGLGFNVQSDGESYLWLKVANIRGTVELRFDDERLPATMSGELMTCQIPKKNYIKPGEHKVYLFNPSTGMCSNFVVFSVK